MSDYGDFCREQRQWKRERNNKRYETNARLIRESLGRNPQIIASERDGGCVRMALNGVVVDYWLSTGTLRAVRNAGSKESKTDIRGDRAVTWLMTKAQQRGA